MSYLEAAAAELDSIRAANGEMRRRAKALRANGEDVRAGVLEEVVAETSFRLAADYMTLAALGQAVAPSPAATPGPGQETAP